MTSTDVQARSSFKDSGNRGQPWQEAARCQLAHILLMISPPVLLVQVHAVQMSKERNYRPNYSGEEIKIQRCEGT